MYEKAETLHQEVATILSESLSTSLFYRFVEGINTFNSTYIDVLAQFVMHYCQVQSLTVMAVEYLIPELVGFKMIDQGYSQKRRVIVISNPGLARLLFTRPTFSLERNVQLVKTTRFDDLFNRVDTMPTEYSSVAHTINKLTVNQKAQVLEMLCKLLVVANHVSQHYTQFMLGRELDYQHDVPSPYFDFERLITNEPSRTIQDYLRRG